MLFICQFTISMQVNIDWESHYCWRPLYRGGHDRGLVSCLRHASHLIHPTTFQKRLLPRLGLEPAPPDFRSGVHPLHHWAKVLSNAVWVESNQHFISYARRGPSPVSQKRQSTPSTTYTRHPETGWDQYDPTILLPYVSLIYFVSNRDLDLGFAWLVR